MRVGYTLWFCVKCSACVQKYMSTVWIDVRGWFCPSVPSSHSIPPSSYHRIIYTRTYFLSFLILSSEIPQIPILIVLHPNDDVLKTLMVGNQLLAGRPDPDHAIPYHTRPRPRQVCVSLQMTEKSPPRLQIDCALDSAYQETVSQYVTIWKYRVGSRYNFSVGQLCISVWRSTLLWWWQRWR